MNEKEYAEVVISFMNLAKSYSGTIRELVDNTQVLLEAFSPNNV